MSAGIFDRWGLNPREQRVATIGLAVFAVVVLVAVPVGVRSIVAGRCSETDEVRAALEAVNQARGKLRQRQERKASLAKRYATKAPPLAGFIEQSASAQKLQVVDSVDRPDLKIGKRYVERSSVVHVKKASMAPIARMLEAIETSPYPVSISRLNVRKRAGEPDSYDLELGVSAFDRNESSSSSSSSPEAKP